MEVDHRGKLLWKRRVARGPLGTPLLHGQFLYIPSRDQGLLVMDLPNRKVLQQVMASDGVSSTPAAAGDLILMISNSGRLFWYRS